MKNKHKNSRILTTAGVCTKNALQLKGYFQVMIKNLDDTWICEDNFVESHVCFVRDDYVDKLTASTKNKCETLIIINMNKNSHFYDYKYQLNTPITARKVEYILNKISREVTYKEIEHELIGQNNTFDKFKSAVSSFFGNNQPLVADSLHSKREKVLTNLSQKINVKDSIANKILFIGSPGAGKSKLIETSKNISSANSTDTQNKNIQNNAGIDYAEIELKDETMITLIGIPDQIKLEFIWDIVGRNISAFVIVLDMSRPELFDYLKLYLRMIHAETDNTADIYCALTHSDKLNTIPDDISHQINSEFPSIINSFILDCRVNQEVFLMLGSIYNCSIELNKEKHQEQK